MLEDAANDEHTLYCIDTTTASTPMIENIELSPTPTADIITTEEESANLQSFFEDISDEEFTKNEPTIITTKPNRHNNNNNNNNNNIQWI